MPKGAKRSSSRGCRKSTIVTSATTAAGGRPLQNLVRRRIQLGGNYERMPDRKAEEGTVRNLSKTMVNRRSRSDRFQCRIGSLDNYDPRDLRDLVRAHGSAHTPRNFGQRGRPIVFNPLGRYHQIPDVWCVLSKKESEEIEGPLLLGKSPCQSAKSTD